MSTPAHGMVWVNAYAVASVVLAFVAAPLYVFRERRKNAFAIPGRPALAVCSGVAWTLALASAVLYFGSIVWANVRGGFRFYDPVLMRIYGYGTLLSLRGIVFGLLSVWRGRKVRWGAGALSIVMTALWFIAAMGE
jgi:hypothetical protein